MLQNDYAYKIICQSNYFENYNIVYDKKPAEITYKQYFEQNMEKAAKFKRIFNLLLKRQNQDTNIDYFKDLQLEKPFISDQKKVKNIISTFKIDYSCIPRDILLLYRIMNGQDEISESDQEQLLNNTFLFGKISYYDTTIAFSFTPFTQPPCGFLQNLKALPFIKIVYNQQSSKRLYIDCENVLQQGRECIYSFLSVEQNGDMYLCIHDQSIQSFLENVQYANYDPDFECLDLVDTLYHPGSDTTTQGIRIRATAYFVPFDQHNSIDAFFYTYTIRISDNGVAPNKRYKLTHRNWIIKCDEQPDKQEIVSGPGVIGLYPEVFQGCEDFVYQSCCPQKGFTGSMKGSFQFRDMQTGEIIIANIDEFPLRPNIRQKIKDIDDSSKGKNILIRGGVHNLRSVGGTAFLIMRQQFLTIQVVALKNANMISKTMIKWMKKIPFESIVDIYGVVQKPNILINCASSEYEIYLNKIFVVSRGSYFRIGLADILRLKKESIKEIINENQEIDFEKRSCQSNQLSYNLNNKVIDLRTPANLAIFKLKSSICQLFRQNLLQQGFIEIHTPKIIQSFKQKYSDSFSLDYFGIDAKLRNQPKLYLQKAIQSDFERVFEIGPNYKKIHGSTHQHLCEFIGMNIEMSIKESYQEIIDVVGNLLLSIFQGIDMMFQQDLLIIKEYFPSNSIKIKNPILQISFQEACNLIGGETNQMDYLDIASQAKLSKIISQKCDTDFYVITQYPSLNTNFINMVSNENPNYTFTYKFFLRNGEIASGSQRIHDPIILEKRALLQQGKDINLIKKYIDIISYGAYPHGGCCIGLERLILYYCDLLNIGKASMFPRDNKTKIF